MRLDQLTFTRFLAAIAIVFYHFGKKLFPFNTELIAPILGQAHIGVSYFFVLSGFVMIIAYQKKDKPAIKPKRYFVNRLARIYPVYILALLLAVIYCIGAKNPISITSLLLNATLLQGFFPAYATSINGPAWSLSVELMFYISFPLLFNHFYRKSSTLTIGLLVVIVWLISQVIMHQLKFSEFYTGFPSASHNLIYYFPFMHINQFMIGSLAGMLFLNYKDQKQGNYDIPLIILVSGLFIILFFKPYYVDYHNGLLAPYFALIIVILSLNTGYITKLFKHKWLIYLGEISYGVYILQKPIFGIFKGVYQKLPFNNQPYIYFILATVLLMVVSGLSYSYFEKPMRDKIKSVFT